jgi:hypothetical protein
MTFGWSLVLVALVFAIGVSVFRPAAEAQRVPSTATAGARYSVVDSEGTNLTVVDNTTNTLYFYCTDPDKTVGADLHLRGSIELKDIGKPVLRPKKTDK